MKNNSYEICNWPSFLGPGIEIDWNLVTKITPPGAIEWLKAQPLVDCQLVLDKGPNHSRLIAEFFNKTTEVEYCLRWAK